MSGCLCWPWLLSTFKYLGVAAAVADCRAGLVLVLLAIGVNLIVSTSQLGA
jgi:hypothetical protein